MNTIQKIYNKYFLVITSLFLFAFLCFWGKQGFDLTDEGFVLYYYQHFMPNEEVGCGMYLTYLIGSIWNCIAGWGGWYNFRILNALLLVSVYVIIYLLLYEFRRYKHWIFIASFLVILNMLMEHGMLVFHYYTASTFFNCLIAYLLFTGFINKNHKKILICSFILGMNVFIRIPNLTLLIIPYVLIGLNYIYDKDIQSSMRTTILCTIGILLGIAFVLFIMALLGHIPSLINTFFSLSSSASDDNSSHSISNMLNWCVGQYWKIFFYSLIIIGFVVLTKNLSRVTLKNNNYLYLIFQCLIFVIGIILIRKAKLFTSNRTLLIVALSCTALFYCCKKNIKDKNLILLSTIAVSIGFLQPLGSDGIFTNMGPYSIMVLAPTACVVFMAKGFPYAQLTTTRHLVITIIFFLCSWFTYYTWQHCYRDEGKRIEKTYTIKNSTFATVLTSKERACSIDKILNIINEKYAKKPIAFIPDIPGLYAISRKEAFFKNRPWPMLLQPELFVHEFQNACKQKGVPVIVLHKKYMKSKKRTVAYFEKNFHYILAKHKYILIWQDSSFAIYFTSK